MNRRRRLFFSGSTGSVPAAPSGLSASATSSSQIDLSWTDNSSNETGFKVERSPDNATWNQIGTAAADATSYSDTGLTAQTTYYYRVRAYNGAGNSSYATATSATTPIAPITDAFNRANSSTTLGSTDTGQAWTAHSGVWGISSNQAYCDTDNGGVNFATVPAAADGTLQVKLPVSGGGSGGSAWVVFRLSDASNALYVVGSSVEQYKVIRRQSGAATLLATGTIASASANDVVKVILSGTSIKVYINNVLDIDTTSTFNQSATRVGIGTDFGAGPSVSRFDDFSFTQ